MTGRVRLGAQALAVGAVVALLGLLVWKVAFGSDNGVTGPLAAGDTPAAPAFDLERLDGDGRISLESLRGQAVVLNWWATWCSPCREEMPLLQEAWQRWEGKGVVFVGIDVQDLRSDAREFLEETGVTYENVYDGKGSTVGRYGLTGYPETYFIDADGDVVYRIAGPIDDPEDLDEGIERALAGA